jgi:hypothetical protein
MKCPSTLKAVTAGDAARDARSSKRMFPAAERGQDLPGEVVCFAK